MADYVATVTFKLDDQLSPGANTASKNLDALAKAAASAGVATDGFSARTSRVGKSFDAINNSIDEQAKLTADLARINGVFAQQMDTLTTKYVSEGRSVDDLAQAEARLTASRDASIAAARRQSAAMTEYFAVVASGGVAFQQLNMQLNEQAKLAADVAQIDKQYAENLRSLREGAVASKMSVEDLGQAEKRLGDIREQSIQQARQAAAAQKSYYDQLDGSVQANQRLVSAVSALETEYDKLMTKASDSLRISKEVAAVNQAHAESIDVVRASYGSLGPEIESLTTIEARLAAQRDGEIEKITGLAEAERERTAAMKQTTDAAEATFAKLNAQAGLTQRLAAIDKEFNTELNHMSLLLKQGKTDLDGYNESVAVLTGRRIAETKAATDAATKQQALNEKLKDGQVSALRSGDAARQMGIQFVQGFSQIASGQGVFLALIDQGHQMIDIALASGKGFGAMLAPLRALVTPIGAAITGLVALGAAFAVVLAHTINLAARERELEVVLAGTGKTGMVSVDVLEQYGRALERTGVSADDTRKILVEFARTPFITTDRINSVLSMTDGVKKLATIMGTDAPAAFKLLTEAETGHIDAIHKIDDAMHILDPAGKAYIEDQVKTKGALADVVPFLEKLTARLKDIPEAATGAAQGAMTIGTAWDQFLDRLGKTQLMQAAMKAIVDTLRNANAADLQKQISDLTTQLEDSKKALKEGGPIVLGVDLETGPIYGVGSTIKQQQIANLEQQIADKKKQLEDMNKPIVVPPEDPAVKAAREAAARQRDIQARSQTESSGADAKKRAVAEQNKRDFQEEMDRLKAKGTLTKEEQAYMTDLSLAYKKQEQDIAALDKKNKEHISTQQKQSDVLDAQIDAQNELSEAYAKGEHAVLLITSREEARKSLINDGLAKSKDFNRLLDERTQKELTLHEAEGKTDYEKQLRNINDQVDAQNRVIAAYDGTQQSIDHATNANKAYAIVLKENIEPGTEAFTQRVTELTSALDKSTASQKLFAQQQSSVQAITDILSNSMDQLGQGIVNAFTSGAGSAVNFGNIMKSIISSIATQIAKLAVINPIINSILGQNLPTLSAGLSVLSGGGGGTSGGGATVTDSSGNVLGTLSNAGSLVSGANTLSGGSLFSSLGLTGPNGLFSGIGTSISNFMSAPLFGSQALTSSTTSALAGMGGQFGPATAAQVGIGGTSVGSALGGIGLGFTAGSLAGSFIQNSMGKTGPAPMIGAGVGAAAGMLIGSMFGMPIIGGLIGGLIGGGGGGLIGPKAPSPYAVGTYTTNAQGQLQMGAVASQKMEAGPMVAQLAQDINQINQVLGAGNIKIGDTGGRFFVGSDEKHAAIQDTKAITATLADAFKDFTFTSDDPTKAAFLQGRKFGDIGQLNTVVGTFVNFTNSLTAAGKGDLITKFVDQLKSLATADLPAQLDKINQFVVGTVPALVALGKHTDVTGALPDQIKALNAQFDAAMVTAKELNYAEQDLTDARAKALQMAQDAAWETVVAANKDIQFRAHAAEVTLGSFDAQTATLEQFDDKAATERKNFSDQLTQLYGDSFKSTTAYATEMALLEKTLGEERLATVKQFTDQAKQASAQVVTSLSAYTLSLQVGQNTPLSPQQQYDLAQKQFRAVSGAAQAGDYTSLTQVQQYSDAFLNASRQMFGSGTGYVNDFTNVLDILDSISKTSADQLTASYFAAQTKAQTTAIVDALASLQKEVGQVRLALQSSTTTPDRIAA